VVLQNRVTPCGDILALRGRGLVMGNRGVLHDDERHIVRDWQVRRWIACRLAFRGRHRPIMRPRRWTELFFLDEAAAFSAGHRPCAECRNADYKRFRSIWEYCFGGPTSAERIDAALHAERLDGHAKRTYRSDIGALPDGTYIAMEAAPWLIEGDSMLAWSDRGYYLRRPRPARAVVEILTPRSIVRIFASGYRPLIHPEPIGPEIGAPRGRRND
jgi:hypothetical protein